MRSRALVVVFLPVALFLIASCAGRHILPDTPAFEREVVIFLEVDEAAAAASKAVQTPEGMRYESPEAIRVTPLYARVRWPRQKVLWVSDRPDDDIISVEFLDRERGNPDCRGKGRKCDKSFERGRPGQYTYRVTIRRGEALYVKNPPDLIIDF